jgi:hypothetical protein
MVRGAEAGDDDTGILTWAPWPLSGGQRWMSLGHVEADEVTFDSDWEDPAGVRLALTGGTVTVTERLTRSQLWRWHRLLSGQRRVSRRVVVSGRVRLLRARRGRRTR